MTRYDLNARRSELIALIKAKTGLRAFKARTVRDPGNGGFQLKDAGTPGFFGMLVMGRGGDNHADFMAARRVLLDAGVRETYLNEPGCAMVFWPWPGAAPHAKPRTNPEATLPAWLTALDGARYFTREALATAVAESGWRSRTALVAMAPETFLALAYAGYMPEKAANVDAALQTTGAFWDVPYLMVEENGDSAQVTGHEGRHRARALQALGVREMPVRIHARWLRWQETPEDAPRWLIPEKGGYGRARVAMPPILGAARQNGGPVRNKKYPYYIFHKPTDKVLAGYDYREDAVEMLSDMPYPKNELAVKTHAWIERTFGKVSWARG